METIFINANAAFRLLFDYILQNGKLKSGTRYVHNVVLTIVRPWDNVITEPWRKWNKQYAELEWDWYKSGDRNPAAVERIARIWSDMKDDSGYVNSNYGNWWLRNNQLEHVIELLMKDNQTRRAVVVHYSPDEIGNYQKDTPCNIVLNFYIEDNKLYLTIFARSIDLVYGFCNDQYCFSRLLMSVAETLQLGCGSMTYMITDLHIYEKHYEMKNKYYNVQQLSL